MRVRMDMISVISAERVIPAYDLLTSLGLPELKHAKGIGFYPNRFASPADLIYVMSAEGTYKLDRETFKTDESLEIGNIDFILPLVNEHVVCYTSVNNASTAGALASLCVTDAGNAYARQVGLFWSRFEYPINTSERERPEYKVAPYGSKYGPSGNGETALLP